MSKTATLNQEEVRTLYLAKVFAGLPNKLKTILADENTTINNSAPVIKSTICNNLLVLDQTQRFSKVLFISELEHNDNESIFEVRQETPTFSDNVNDYPIYRVGISFEDGERSYISGKERELLDEKQLYKWDYFFRQTKGLIGKKHVELIGELKIWENGYQSKKTNLLIKFILIVLVYILMFIKMHLVIATGLSILILLRFGSDLLSLYTVHRNIGRIQKSILSLEKEQVLLESKLDQKQVSGKQMEYWLDEEIREIDRHVIKSLNMSIGKFANRKLSTGERNTNGYCIEEWGLVQPLSANGKKGIKSDHLRAYRSNKGKPLVGVYYIYLIYLSEETLGVSGFFYDFILAKRFGQTTNQYYYRDIVSIGTIIEDTIFLSGQEEMETKKIVLSFYNSERISITLTDQIVIENLRKKIESKQKIDSILKPSGLGIDALDHLEFNEFIKSASDELPATRTNTILKIVQSYWNEKKQSGASDSGSIGG